MPKPSPPLQAVQQWFENVVLGLNLCPFAHRPARAQQIKFVVCESGDETALMASVIREMENLENTTAQEWETTLVITPHLLGDFYDYQFFLDEANRKLKYHHWQGVFQLASFHPHYCFAGVEPDDASNLTNRSPYPIIHILRESSLSDVLAQVENPDEIPHANMQRMDDLSPSEKTALFPYLTPTQ